MLTRPHNPDFLVAAEPFYESQYNKGSTTDLHAGCLFPIGKHFEFNTYCEHENDTGKNPNRQQNFVGLAPYLFCTLEKHWRSAPAP